MNINMRYLKFYANEMCYIRWEVEIRWLRPLVEVEASCVDVRECADVDGDASLS